MIDTFFFTAKSFIVSKNIKFLIKSGFDPALVYPCLTFYTLNAVWELLRDGLAQGQGLNSIFRNGD